MTTKFSNNIPMIIEDTKYSITGLLLSRRRLKASASTIIATSDPTKAVTIRVKTKPVLAYLEIKNPHIGRYSNEPPGNS
jgi:hypothetical protein